MPHESTVEHTGEVFEPTPTAGLGPRGFSVVDDGPSKGSSASLSSLGSSVFGNSSSATQLDCIQDADNDDSKVTCGGLDEGVSFTVGGNGNTND